MKLRGVVIRSEGERVLVAIEEVGSKCEGCSMRLLCGINPKTRKLWARPLGHLIPGTPVEVELTEARAVMLSTLVFLVPAAIYILSFAGLRLIMPQWAAALVAFIPMLAWFLLMRLRALAQFFSPVARRLE